MDDLAPAPAQWTSDDVGRTQEQLSAARKKAVKKAPPPPANELEPESESGFMPEPESDHELDLLA